MVTVTWGGRVEGFGGREWRVCVCVFMAQLKEMHTLSKIYTVMHRNRRNDGDPDETKDFFLNYRRAVMPSDEAIMWLVNCIIRHILSMHSPEYRTTILSPYWTHYRERQFKVPTRSDKQYSLLYTNTLSINSMYIINTSNPYTHSFTDKLLDATLLFAGCTKTYQVL